jgi:hypothetical protein
MRILTLFILFAILIFSAQKGESPHGPDLKISCTNCHSSKGWQLDREIYSFDHDKTKLALTGQHALLNCRECHPTLVFSAAKANCNECHTDMHQGSVGLDCARCHTSASWLVSNITEIHQRSRFPLLGAHRTADCYTCHKSENMIRFDVLGINCIDCHRENYMSTTNPNHTEAGFSQDCSVCHPVNAFQWTGAGFNHNFFPLVDGHSTVQCSACHTTGNYADAKPECFSCHQQDYLATTNPNHTAASFPTACQTCHTLAPGWKPAKFDHSSFPLTFGHANVACADCHKNGNYNSTSTDCYSCHQTNYNNTTNPNHQTLAFSTQCTQCHNTNPGWKPAKYTQHDSQFFPIYSGRHNGTWDLCSQCHNNPNNYAVFDCKTCHANVHQGENYTNAQCYSCHPTGQSGGR